MPPKPIYTYAMRREIGRHITSTSLADAFHAATAGAAFALGRSDIGRLGLSRPRAGGPEEPTDDACPRSAALAGPRLCRPSRSQAVHRWASRGRAGPGGAVDHAAALESLTEAWRARSPPSPAMTGRNAKPINYAAEPADDPKDEPTSWSLGVTLRKVHLITATLAVECEPARSRTASPYAVENIVQGRKQALDARSREPERMEEACRGSAGRHRGAGVAPCLFQSNRPCFGRRGAPPARRPFVRRRRLHGGNRCAYRPLGAGQIRGG